MSARLTARWAGKLVVDDERVILLPANGVTVRHDAPTIAVGVAVLYSDDTPVLYSDSTPVVYA